MRLGAAIAIALAACGGPEPEPRFRVTCVPDPTREFVMCTVENHGTGPGRACLTVQLKAPEDAPLIARRVCVPAVAPGASATTSPQFDQIAQTRVRKTVASRCVKDGDWICKIDVLEAPQQLVENLPPER